jgi:hypothetical protein
MGEIDGSIEIYNVYAVNDGNTEVRFSDLNVQLAASDDDTGVVGDVNGDEEVSVTDIQAIINLILANAGVAENPRADVNGDGSISVTDIQSVVNMILNSGGNAPASRAASRVAATAEDNASLYVEPFSINAGEEMDMTVLLESNGDGFSSFQFDVNLPRWRRVQEEQPWKANRKGQ